MPEARTSHEVDHYRVLGVELDASAEAIKAAHRAMAQRWHPDRPGGSAERMGAISDAWAVLGDPRARGRYDRGRALAAIRRAAAAEASARRSAPGPEPASVASGGAVIDYGPYRGWSIARLARDDPEYLRWLARTPSGRSYRAEIEALLGVGPKAGPLRGVGRGFGRPVRT